MCYLVGDWVYMLFMHQACVYETKEQYIKSNTILTAVMKEAHEDGRIHDLLKEAIEAFQLKMIGKQEYLAYYVRKFIPNCYDAMTTSPVESINCYIKHRSKASTLNNTSRSLMLITDGTDNRIAGLDQSGKCHTMILFVSSIRMTICFNIFRSVNSYDYPFLTNQLLVMFS